MVDWRIDLHCQDDLAGIVAVSTGIAVLLMHTPLLGGVDWSCGDSFAGGFASLTGAGNPSV